MISPFAFNPRMRSKTTTGTSLVDSGLGEFLAVLLISFCVGAAFK